VAAEVAVAAVEWDVVEVIIQRVGTGMVPEMVLEMEQGQEKDLVIQGVDIGMARGMEPAQETDLKMGADTGPKKAVEPAQVKDLVMEPGTVTALAVKGKAAVVEIATDCT